MNIRTAFRCGCRSGVGWRHYGDVRGISGSKVLSIFCLILQNALSGPGPSALPPAQVSRSPPHSRCHPMTLNDADSIATAAATDTTNAPDSELDSARRELVDLLTHLTGEVEGTINTAIAGLSVHRIVSSGGPKGNRPYARAGADRTGLQTRTGRGGAVRIRPSALLGDLGGSSGGRQGHRREPDGALPRGCVSISISTPSRS